MYDNTTSWWFVNEIESKAAEKQLTKMKKINKN